MKADLKDQGSARGGETLFPAPDIEMIRRGDGAILLRSRAKLPPYPSAIGHDLLHWAKAAPDRLFLAQRRADGVWRKLTYREALETVRAIGQALLDRGLGPERPIMLIAENGIDHALLALAAMHVGIPAAPISTAYSRLSHDYAKLKHIVARLTPGLVYVDDGSVHKGALATLDFAGAELVVSANPPPGRAATEFAALCASQAYSGGRSRLRRHWPRHHRQGALYLGLDRHAQGRDQHSAHADVEPDHVDLLLAVSRSTTAGAGRLAAVESYLRRQSQFQHGVAPWRHVMDRRRQARAGFDRPHDRQSARNLADHRLQRAARFCPAARLFENDRGARGRFFSNISFLSSTPAPPCRKPCGNGLNRLILRRPRPPTADDLGLGPDGNRAHG